MQNDTGKLIDYFVNFKDCDYILGNKQTGICRNLYSDFSLEISFSQDYDDELNIYLNSPKFARCMSIIFCDSDKYDKNSIGHLYLPKKLRNDSTVGNLALSSPSLTNEKKQLCLVNGGVNITLTEFNEIVEKLSSPDYLYRFYQNNELTDFFVILESVWVVIYLSLCRGDSSESTLEHIKELEKSSKWAKSWRLKKEMDLDIVNRFKVAYDSL